MNFMPRVIIFILVIGAYVAFSIYLKYALENHPWAFLSAIAIGGMPIGYWGLRYSRKNAQRRSIWSTTQSYVKSDVSVVPEPPQEEKYIGTGRIDEIDFKAVWIYASTGGIRIERFSGPDGPIVIGWKWIQRLDLLRFQEQEKTEHQHGALISLKSVDRQILLIPWPENFNALIPENVGQRTHLVTQ